MATSDCTRVLPKTPSLEELSASAETNCLASSASEFSRYVRAWISEMSVWELEDVVVDFVQEVTLEDVEDRVADPVCVLTVDVEVAVVGV